MLDDFKIEQPVAYKVFINAIKNNKLSHAYIIETHGYSNSYELALSFAKYILCPFNYSNYDKCKNCFQCKTIDKNEFIELKILEADGQWIKKSQLDELQSDFSKKTLVGNKKIYIIKFADKLNASSSNSLLKFLEEPEEGIIAILIVENVSMLLNTIVSRCQIISLKNNDSFSNLNTIEILAEILKTKREEKIEFIESENSSQKVNDTINFINYYEKNKTSTIIYVNKLIGDYLKDRNDVYDMLSMMLLFYKDALNYKIGKDIKVFVDYKKEILEISSNNSTDLLISKINVIMNLREKIKFNVNSNMLMDKLIIELEGCE